MGPDWAHAFLVASLLTLAGTPVLRRVALATEFVDHPVASHKSHRTPTPYLGGIGLIVAVLVGLAFTSHLSAEVGVIALGGTLVGCLGLVDDHRSVGALFRFVIEALVAAAVLAAGLRAHATDVPALDAVITVIWIVGVTNAVNLLDNMDGLAAGVAAAAAVAIFALAILGEQSITATIAAGLAGACVGFVFHNKRPASIFMGDTGSLFLGFVLAVVCIDVSPALRPPASFAVPLMLLALPVLDTATVTVCRMRHDISVSQGGKDHLSHRLVALHVPPAWAVRVLVGAEGVVGLLAVLAGRKVLPLWTSMLLGAALLTALLFFCLRAKVYAEPVTGLPRTLRLVVAAGVLATLALAAPAATALARAQGPGNRGAAAVLEGLAALRAGDAAAATAAFDRADSDLRRADHVLGGRMTTLGLAIPGLRANVATARALVRAGRTAATAGPDLPSLVEARALPLAGPDAGTRAEQLEPVLARSATLLGDAASELKGYDRPYLWPTLGDRVKGLRDRLLDASADASTTTDSTRLLPGIVGTRGPRHYFVAVLDNSELRGSGGVPHIWGEIVADDGRLTLSHVGPIEELDVNSQPRTITGNSELTERYASFNVADTWQNVTVSPDFAVTGGVISSLFAQSQGRPVDGVIGVDLPGLARMLDLSGPVTVDGWPGPISGADLTDTILHRAQERFPDDRDRSAFSLRVVSTVLQSFLAQDLGTPTRVIDALGTVARGRHVALFAQRQDEQRLFERIGVAGRPVTGEGDSIFVVNENLSGSGVDAFLHRTISYDVRLDPGRAPAAISGEVTVTLRNDAPAQGLPRSSIGPYDERFSAGENRTLVSIYSQLPTVSPPPDVSSGRELGLQASSSVISIPSRQSRAVTLAVAGRMQLGSGNWYRLAIPQQPSLNPDDTVVHLSIPPGWRLAELVGMHKVDDRHAVATSSELASGEVSVRVERTMWSRLWSSDRS